MSTLKSAVVIPARLESTRLPRKVLADICGWPMIRHVYHRAQQATLPSEVLVATDSEEVAANVKGWGGRAVMTSPDCTCGTDRIASMVDQVDAEIIVNVQGDEPLLEPRIIDQLIDAIESRGADVVIPVRKIETMAELTSLAAVKAVLNRDSTVMFMSRGAVPVIRDAAPETWLAHHDYWVVIGTASFRRATLLEYRNWDEGILEQLEKIEQFRFLEAGKQISAIETELESVAVDLPQDLEKVRRLVEDLRRRSEDSSGGNKE